MATTETCTRDLDPPTHQKQCKFVRLTPLRSVRQKININPKYRVLMLLPSTVQVLCSTWFIEVNLCKILMAFVSGINGQKEYCLSLA